VRNKKSSPSERVKRLYSTPLHRRRYGATPGEARGRLTQESRASDHQDMSRSAEAIDRAAKLAA